jgi:methionine synthase II (cobalamin-independent)
VAASLGEGLRAHVADVARRVPGATVLLQLDEPSLPAVLAGQIPTESGLYTLRSVAPALAQSALRSIVDAVGVPVIVHCCAPDVPLDLLAGAGVAAVSLDLALFDASGKVALDRLGELLDAGIGLFAGAVPSLGAPPAPTKVADGIVQLWQRLGFALSGLPAQVVVTPACGLAGSTRPAALATLAVAVEAGRRLAEHRE